MTVLGLALTAGLVLTVGYFALSVFVFWELFTFFLTTLRFARGAKRERASFAVSFVGGYLMLLIPIIVAFSGSPVLPPGGCLQFRYSVAYYCWGTPIGEYYAVINQMTIVGGIAVVGSLIYAVHPRGRLPSGILLLSAPVAFSVIVLSTLLSWVFALVSLSSAAGGLLILSLRTTTSPPTVESFGGNVLKVLPRRMGVAILLLILLVGVFGGVWGYASEAATSVRVCAPSLPGAVSTYNETVGVNNPSYLPLHAVWKITYNYTQGSVNTDTESFEIPPHSTAYPRFTLQRTGTVNSTYPLIISYERTYGALLWSFVQRGSWTVTANGPDYGQPDVTIPTC